MNYVYHLRAFTIVSYSEHHEFRKTAYCVKQRVNFLDEKALLFSKIKTAPHQESVFEMNST